MDGTPVVLASASPRRRELLDLIGISHRVEPADIDESIHGAEQPAAHVERLAREKALKIAARHPGALVIAADTVVVLDGQIMGKPRTKEDARSMLAALSGATHTVVTGMACALNGELESSVDDVSVTFRLLSEQEIQEYVATGEPMDKAGSYGIQGRAAALVAGIDGDFYTVMGFPLGGFVRSLRRSGFVPPAANRSR